MSTKTLGGIIFLVMGRTPSNNERTRTSFFEHRTNSNMFIYWGSNSNTLFLAWKERTSNLIGLSLDLQNYSSNWLEHHFFKHPCSNSFDVWRNDVRTNSNKFTRTPWFWISNDWTSNFIPFSKKFSEELYFVCTRRKSSSYCFSVNFFFKEPVCNQGYLCNKNYPGYGSFLMKGYKKYTSKIVKIKEKNVRASEKFVKL